MTPAKILAGIASVVVIGAVGAGLYFAGSPVTARQKNLDGQRLAALQSIAGGIDAYYDKHGANPEALDVLKGTDPNEVYYVSEGSFADPETKAPYGYVR
ncbi:MAG: hypothetical protein RLZZ324_355, partial [Candidatus Parcubacteria bacterium]